MKKLIKAIVLASALIFPAFFAGNVYAAAISKSCGSCAIGTAPASHASYGVTNTTLCSVCHTLPAIPATPAKPGKPTIPAISATPAMPAAITVRPTSHDCDACIVGTAPGSVSAHKNVNVKMIACSLCHGATNVSTGSATGGHADDHRGTSGGHTDNHSGSPGNSEFGHSHKHDKKQHRDHSN